MDLLTDLALPLALLACVFLLKRIKVWAQAEAAQSAQRSELIQEFHADAMHFMKITDPKDHANARDLVLFVAEKMIDGPMLVKAVIFFRGQAPNGKGNIQARETLDRLSDEQLHALAKVLATALLVSSFNSLFFGRFYRAALSLALKNGRELSNPEQVVLRFKPSRDVDYKHKALC